MSWWAGASIGILQVLAVLISDTQTTNEAIAQPRDTNEENELGKTINMCFTFILGAILHKKGMGKKMREIWAECARFKTRSQRLADQARSIIRRGWFSDHQILEIHQQINRETCQQYPNS